MSEASGNPPATDLEHPESAPGMRKPAMVYIIAIFFTAVCLFSVTSVLYVLFYKLSAEMRGQLLASAALAPMAIAELNGLLMMVAAWLLVAMRRIGAGLMLASTLLVATLIAISWPGILHQYFQHPTPELLHPLLLGGSNLVLHIAATVYAFRLSSKGLLR